MPRASREDAERHREEIIDAASRLFREKGIEGVSVPELMAAVGLTHGGFYKQFKSKDALAALAFERASTKIVGELRERIAAAAGTLEARQVFLDAYLAPEHRDNPAMGCVLSCLAGDLGRDSDQGLRDAFMRGMGRMIERLEAVEDPAPLATLSTLIGAVALSRATMGTPLSDEILDAVKDSLSTQK
ncbi:TetR/AcrR family transcriptional regulator [Flaviflagellibacter deserti]|uniref:TetR/AcrR family transcriptional regulator n=1 Tax=Flaviflagellibacter deserti TaxID=2267266 RepID=A0ABV9Z698_9HYPH